MKADAMLAEFIMLGGKHEVLARDHEKASIKLTINKQTQTFTLTWEEAKKEPFVYEGKEADVVAAITAGKTDALRLKPKYATPRSRTQMLWARVVSDGVRAMAPTVVAGYYAPEEIGGDEIEGEIVAVNGKPTNGKTKTVEEIMAEAQAKGSANVAANPSGPGKTTAAVVPPANATPAATAPTETVIDVTPEPPTSEPAETVSTSPQEPADPFIDPITDAQKQQIAEMVSAIEKHDAEIGQKLINLLMKNVLDEPRREKVRAGAKIVGLLSKQEADNVLQSLYAKQADIEKAKVAGAAPKN